MTPVSGVDPVIESIHGIVSRIDDRGKDQDETLVSMRGVLATILLLVKKLGTEGANEKLSQSAAWQELNHNMSTLRALEAEKHKQLREMFDNPELLAVMVSKPVLDKARQLSRKASIELGEIQDGATVRYRRRKEDSTGVHDLYHRNGRPHLWRERALKQAVIAAKKIWGVLLAGFLGWLAHKVGIIK